MTPLSKRPLGEFKLVNEVIKRAIVAGSRRQEAPEGTGLRDALDKLAAALDAWAEARQR